MSHDLRASSTEIRRCPNCGTRVAQSAETCYFCGHDLTGAKPSGRRLSWLDLALVVALLLVVMYWWQAGSRGDTAAESATPAPTAPQEEVASGPTAITAPEQPGTPPTEAPAEEAPEQMFVRHTVEAGETLLSIAQRYGVTVADIQAANGLDTELIQAGSTLVIPVPQAIAGVQEEPAPMQVVFRYVVQPGDTIVSIAVRFGATVESILDANSLGPEDFIQPQQVLRVPVEGAPAAVLASSEEARGQSTTDLPLYEAPRLLSPDDGETIPREEDVLFRWISVDLLAPNEWYVLRIWPLEGAGGLLPAIWTQATSHRLSSAFAPEIGAVNRFGWQVNVVRVLPDVGEGREIQSASQPSPVRNFTWR